MKKIFPIILFVILCSNLIAQSNSIGVFGGLNVSNANVSVTKTENPDGNIGFNRKSLIGFVGGLKYQRVFNIPFVLDVEMIMNQLGYQVNYDNEPNEHIVVVNQVDKYIIRYNYISIPILFGYKVGDVLSVTPKIGFQSSYLINGIAKSNIANNDMDLENYNRFDLAGVVEVELCYMFNDCWGVFACFDGKYSFTNYMKLNNDSVAKHYSFSTVCGVKYSF